MSTDPKSGKHADQRQRSPLHVPARELHAQTVATIRRLLPFGNYEPADLGLARTIATQVVERYGENTAEEMARIRRDGIWNDHPAVQAALVAIKYVRQEG